MNFRLITAKFSGIRKFRNFTVMHSQFLVIYIKGPVDIKFVFYIYSYSLIDVALLSVLLLSRYFHRQDFI